MNQDSSLSSGVCLRPALQLWTVRELAERDMVATLRAVAALGYRAVEFAGYNAAQIGATYAALEECGVQALSAHVSYNLLRDGLDKVISDMRALGCSRVVVPAFARELRDTMDKARRLAGSLNDIGVGLNRAGLAFAYHNEDYDFAPLGDGDRTLWDVLTDETDSTYVGLQFDLFTAALMGVDLIATLHKHAGRIVSVHVCDMRNRGYVPIGQGDLDWTALLAAIRFTVAEWIIVEHDAPPDPLAAASASLVALTEMLEASPNVTRAAGQA